MRAGSGATKRRVCARGDRQTDAGQAQNQFVRLLSGRQPRAFAHRVANVAEHEQIPERGAGQPCHVIGFAGDESQREALRRMRRGRIFRHRGIHFVDQRGIECDVTVGGKIDEALGQIAVLGGERLPRFRAPPVRR